MSGSVIILWLMINQVRQDIRDNRNTDREEIIIKFLKTYYNAQPDYWDLMIYILMMKYRE